jgi:hypothetical protein
VPIALEKESFLPSLEVCAQFVRQRREDWYVTIGLPLGVGDVDLGRITGPQFERATAVRVGHGIPRRYFAGFSTFARLRPIRHYISD